MNPIPVLPVTAASPSLAKTFYNRIVEPSSFFSSIFCLTYLHAAYNKQKMDLLYPIPKNRRGEWTFLLQRVINNLTQEIIFPFCRISDSVDISEVTKVIFTDNDKNCYFWNLILYTNFKLTTTFFFKGPCRFKNTEIKSYVLYLVKLVYLKK